MRSRQILVGFLLCFALRSASAQGEAIVVSLLTILSGEALHATFWESAIRVWIPTEGLDLVCNFGQSEAPFDASFV